jgi:hypothetical protein
VSFFFSLGLACSGFEAWDELWKNEWPADHRSQGHPLRRLYFRLRRLHLAVLERAAELELRGLQVELVDHGAYASAGACVSFCLPADT